jgi:hypothetical protein
VSKRITCIGLLLACALNLKAQVNLVLNGSFELNSIASCYNSFANNSDYSNAVVYSNSFGSDHSATLLNLPCLVCVPQYLWGGQPQDGNWTLGLDGRDETIVLPPPTGTIHIIKQGKVSLELDISLLSTKHYKLTFYAKSPPTDIPTSFCMTKKGNFVDIGISNNDTTFGISLFSIPLADTAWQKYTYVFETQNSEKYITIQAGLNGTINKSILLDNFILVETEEPLTTGVNEVSQQEKKLLKIVDILGRESKAIKNTPLFYIYSDGTVVKKVFVE